MHCKFIYMANCNPQCLLHLCNVAFSVFFISGSFLQLYTHKIHVTVHDEK